MQFFVRRNITHKLRLNITYSLFGVHGNNHTLESADCRTLFQSKENSQLEIRFASKNSWALPHESNIRNTPTISKIVPNQKQTMWKCYSTNELEDRFIDHLLRHVTSSGFWWNKGIRPYGPYKGHKGDDCIATNWKSSMRAEFSSPRPTSCGEFRFCIHFVIALAVRSFKFRFGLENERQKVEFSK